LTFDLYGRGKSDCPDTRYTPSLFAGQLAELLYALNINEPFHLIGLSLGGGVASYFARVFPTKVKKLVLIASVGFSVKTNPMSKLVHVPFVGEFIMKNFGKKLLEQTLMRDLIKSIIKIFDPDTNFDDNNTDDKLLTPQDIERQQFELNFRHSQENKGLLRALFSTLKYFPMGNMVEVFEELDRNPRKVLIIHGDDDSTIPYSSAQKMKRSLSNSELLTIKGGKHNITIDQREEIHPQIIRFLFQKEDIDLSSLHWTRSSPMLRIENIVQN